MIKCVRKVYSPVTKSKAARLAVGFGCHLHVAIVCPVSVLNCRALLNRLALQPESALAAVNVQLFPEPTPSNL